MRVIRERQGGLVHEGYAVIDFETTGFSPAHGHRVIEIGLVHVSPGGEIEGSFETLLNPGRDLGPMHIHQIRGNDVADAPTFAEIAGSLVELLRGRVLVAHNARFEATFLAAELARLGFVSPISVEDALCTMRLASTFLPGSGRKLADCCSAYDIELMNAHEALADATATALLLNAYIGASPRTSWAAWGERSSALSWPTIGESTGAWTPRRRQGARPAPRLLDRATDRLPRLVGDQRSEQYLAMLDAALADGLLSVHETDELTELSRELRLDETDRSTLHNQYFGDLVEAAWDDAVLSDDERQEIKTVATLLDIAPTAVEAALNDPRPMATAPEPQDAEPTAVTLHGSSVVVLTGEMRRPRSAIEADLERLGIATSRALTKKTTLLVAADVDSLSGKARKARQYGIPIAGEDEIEAAIASALMPR